MTRSGNKFSCLIHNFARQLLLAVVAISLGGCLFGNGDPYGNKDKGTPPATDTKNQAVVYTWQDKNYTCTPQEGGVPISSHRDQIEQLNGVYYRMGDKCNPIMQELNASDVVLSADNVLLGYREGIYQKNETIAQDVVAVTWCRFDNGTKYVDAYVFSNNTSTACLSDGNETGLQTKAFNTTQGGSEDTPTFDATGFNLSVQLNHPVGLYEYEGTFSLTTEYSFSDSVICRWSAD